jgi:hypothetical protein
MWEETTFKDINDYHKFILDCDEIIKHIESITKNMLLSNCKKISGLNIVRIL